eukprot:scaffold41854_cov78-Phaeocystis_antarctica.AAC.2
MCSSSLWADGEAGTAAASSPSTLSSNRPSSDAAGAGSSPEAGGGGGTRMEALRKKPTGGANGPSSEAGTHAHEGSCDAARSAKPSAISSKAAGVSTGLLANMASDRHTARSSAPTSRV